MKLREIINKTNDVFNEIQLNIDENNQKASNSIDTQDENGEKKEFYLLTGANGFLSQFIIKEMVEQNKNIIAVVRNKEKYEINFSNNISLENKIIIMDYNDVFSPNFNFFLRNNKFLLKGIIHCAAQLNNLFSYEKLEKSNVELTKKLLIHFYHIPIHYISTLSIFASSNQKGVIKEINNNLDNVLNKMIITNIVTKYSNDKNHDLNKDLKYLSDKDIQLLDEYEIYGGYAQTKIVSDFLIRKTNCHNKVYRFDLITPPYVNINHDFRIIKEKQINKDEKINFKKVYENTLLKTFFEIPDKENHKKYKKIKVSMNPVDLCAKSFITTLLNNEKNKRKSIFHFAGQEISLYDLIKTKSKNKSTDLCSKEKLWKSKVHFKLYKNTYYRKKLDFENNDFYKHKKLFNLDLFQTTGFKWKINNRQQRSFYDKIFYIKKLKKLNMEI